MIGTVCLTTAMAAVICGYYAYQLLVNRSTTGQICEAYQGRLARSATGQSDPC